MLNSKFYQERYFFIHLPKTAGTKVRSLLYGEFNQTKIYPNLQDIADNGGAYPKLDEYFDLDPERTSNVRIFTGHYNFYDAMRMIDDPRNCFTFLREPIDRCISQIFHVLRYSDYYKDKSVSYVIDNMYYELSNYQTRYFIKDDRKKNLDSSHLEEARTNLGSLGFVGFTTSLIEGIADLNKIYKWKLPLLNARVNQNEERNDRMISKSDYIRLKEMNQYDLMVYNSLFSQ